MSIDLSAPVDVYSDWVDACDAVANDAATGDDAVRPRGSARRAEQDDSDQEPEELDKSGAMSEDELI